VNANLHRNAAPRPRPRRRPPRGPRWQYSLLSLFVLTTVCAIVLKVYKGFPMETLIVLGIVAGAVLAVMLYVGELVVIGWIVDFPVWLAERALPSAHVPLEHEHVGQVTIVRLSENIASARECRSVQEQIDRLIAEDCCDIVLDFGHVKKLASGFREVLVHVTRTARQAAEKQGQACRDPDLPPGEMFRVFADRDAAIAEMTRQEGHGWVVLCGVPTGIRAVSDAR
jgi:hypothetical protein